MSYLVEHFFAGLWTMIWHFGVGIGVVILLLAGAYFIPVVKAKIALIGLAIFVVAFLVGEGFGIKLEKSHVMAQQAATNNFVDRTVKGTTAPKARKRADPWDSKDN